MTAQWRIFFFFFFHFLIPILIGFIVVDCAGDKMHLDSYFLRVTTNQCEFLFSISWSNIFSLTLNQFECQRGKMSLLLFVMMLGGQLSIFQSYF